MAEIADDLEEKEEVIAPIYEAALSMKPDYDVEKIYAVSYTHLDVYKRQMLWSLNKL